MQGVRVKVIARWPYKVNILCKLDFMFQTPCQFQVSHITVHNKYASTYGWYDRQNDHAFFHLATPINFTKDYKPVCIPETQDYLQYMENTENKTVFVSGWNINKPEQYFSLKVRAVSQATCESIWSAKFSTTVLGSRVCAYVFPGKSLISLFFS